MPPSGPGVTSRPYVWYRFPGHGDPRVSRVLHGTNPVFRDEAAWLLARTPDLEASFRTREMEFVVFDDAGGEDPLRCIIGIAFVPLAALAQGMPVEGAFRLVNPVSKQPAGKIILGMGWHNPLVLASEAQKTTNQRPAMSTAQPPAVTYGGATGGDLLGEAAARLQQPLPGSQQPQGPVPSARPQLGGNLPDFPPRMYGAPPPGSAAAPHQPPYGPQPPAPPASYPQAPAPGSYGSNFGIAAELQPQGQQAPGLRGSGFLPPRIPENRFAMPGAGQAGMQQPQQQPGYMQQQPGYGLGAELGGAATPLPAYSQSPMVPGQQPGYGLQAEASMGSPPMAGSMLLGASGAPGAVAGRPRYTEVDQSISPRMGLLPQVAPPPPAPPLGDVVLSRLSPDPAQWPSPQGNIIISLESVELDPAPMANLGAYSHVFIMHGR